MSLYISSINSGSNGNCYYIGNDSEAVLIDVGISCRELEKRLGRLGLLMTKVKAIFISHEHTDHVRGLATICKKFQLPVYINEATCNACYDLLMPDCIRNISPDEKISIGRLSITAFSKAHDASDPLSFTVEGNGVTVGVFTDLGYVCNNLVRYFKQCHAAFLEANYDEEMLEKGSYPYHLKRRIKGGNGHLSNRQALELFVNHRASFMSHLVPAHLSKNNNCPNLVAQLFEAKANGVEIVVASRYSETKVLQIVASNVLPKLDAVKVSQLQFSF